MSEPKGNGLMDFVQTNNTPQNNGLMDFTQTNDNTQNNGLIDESQNNGLIEETPSNPDYPGYEIQPPNVGPNTADFYNGKVYLKDGFKIWTTMRGDEVKAILNEDGSSTLVDLKFGEETIKVMKVKLTLLKVLEKLSAEYGDEPLIEKYLFDVKQSVKMYDNIFNFMFSHQTQDLVDTN